MELGFKAVPRIWCRSAQWLCAIAFSTGTAAGAPLPPALPGYTAGPVERFDTRTVFQAIDGAAEVFLRYGFTELATWNYDNPTARLEVQLYQLGSPLDAFGVFAIERPTAGQALPIGARALAAPPRQCLLLKGRTFAKVASVRGELSAATCEAVLRSLAGALPGGDAVPTELGLLPTDGQLSDTLGYTREAYLGLACLNNAVHADYRDGSSAFVLLSAPGSAPEAILDRLASAGFKPVDGKDRRTLAREIPYTGFVAVAVGRGVVQGALSEAGLGAALARLGALLQGS